MKLAAKSSNTSRLTFNDLGQDIKGVSPEYKHIALDAGESVYLMNQSGVLYSVSQGDAKKYKAAGLLDIDDVVALADAATKVITHNFGIIPTIQVCKDNAGTWELAVAGTDYSAVTNAALTETTITNISGGALTLNINVG